MNESRLSDRSCASISEQYEGALIRAAFRILEEEEMKQLSQPSPMDAEARRACRRGEPDFRRRLRGRYVVNAMRRFTHRSLPRLIQLTAALISLLALCAGVALAASGNVREWAAGLLIPPSVQPEDSQFTFGEPNLQYTDGAVVNDVLYVASNTASQLYAYHSSSAEPTVLRCARGSSVINALTAYEGQLYALCTTYAEQAADSFSLPADTGVQLSRVVPGADGTYALEPVLTLSNHQLYDGGALDAISRQVTGMTIGGGELCLTTSFSRKSDGQFFQPRYIRMISVHLQSGEIAELIPTAVDEGFFLDMRPFYGDAGQTLVAMQDATAESVHIVRILPDHSLSELTVIGRTDGMSAHFFGYDSEKDVLYYHQGSALYAMPHFDAAQTRRAALSASAEVRGLPIGDGSYALINLRGIRIFDLEQEPDVSGGTLTIDSGTASRELVDAFIAEHGVEVSVASIFSDEILPALRKGDSSIDVFTFQSFDREAPDLLREENAAPIQSESLRDTLGRMLPGVRSVCLRGDAPIALPTAIFVYADVRFYAETLAVYGYTQADLPSTWLEFLHFLRNHAQREQVIPICNNFHNADDFRTALLDRLIAAWLRNPENANFASQDMLLLLDAFREIDFSRFLYAPENPNATDCLLMLNADMNPIFDMGEELVLPVTDGGPAIAQASCKLSTVNPNAQSANLAARFLEFVYDNCAPGEYALMAAQPDSSADSAALRCRSRYDDISFDLTYMQLAEQHYERFHAVLRPFLDGQADSLTLAAQLDAFFGL